MAALVEGVHKNRYGSWMGRTLTPLLVLDPLAAGFFVSRGVHMKDLFGNEDAKDFTQIELPLKGKRKPTQPAGYAGQPGKGPKGKFCKHCKHNYEKRLAKIYHKCLLMSHIWSGGRKTDILVTTPCCEKFEEK